MKKTTSYRLLLSFITALTLAACSSQPDEEQVEKTPDASPQALYQQARQTLDNKLYDKAIGMLSALDSRYPFGPISRQVQLDLIYAYYKSGQSAQSLAHIDRFIRLNPNHPDLDYVYYIRGLVNMSADENLFQEMFGIDRADKDVSFTRDAFNDFKTLLTTFPDSKYGSDARQRMIFLLNKLARHETIVARYYIRRGAYLAAANRGKYVIEYYPESTSIKESLQIMITAYDRLGLDELKNDALRTLRMNFPEAEEEFKEKTFNWDFLEFYKEEDNENDE